MPRLRFNPIGLVFFAFLVVSFGNAQALIKVTTERANFQKSDAWPLLLEQVRHQIKIGIWDSRGIRFPIENKASAMPELANALVTQDGKNLLRVDSASFASLPSTLQDKVVENLASYYDLPNFGAYRVTVDTQENNLNNEPLIQRLGIKVKDLPRVVPAEQLLSEYAQKWAYKDSEQNGANCWHTSIASINHKWEVPRRMFPPEFLCHLKNSFEPIDALSQWGDLVRISSGGEEIHGFTFLGVDSNEPAKKIVFTKNGYMRGNFLFMDFDTVTQMYGGDVSYFRSIRAAIDPKADPSAPCAHAASLNGGWQPERDALIEAGMRIKPPTSFPAMKVN